MFFKVSQCKFGIYSVYKRRVKPAIDEVKVKRIKDICLELEYSKIVRKDYCLELHYPP